MTVRCPCLLKLPHCHAVLLTISVTYQVSDVSWTLTPVTMSFVHLFYLDWTMAIFYAFKRLQNWADKLIFLASKKDKQLHWLPVKQRAQFKVLLYVFKYLADSAPAYLTSSLELYKPVRRGLRSATDTTRLIVPKIYSRINLLLIKRSASMHLGFGMVCQFQCALPSPYLRLKMD